MTIVTISGSAQNGKDTLAQMIEDSISQIDTDKKVMIIHFADFLKFAAKQWFGWDGVKDEKGRTLLQHLGTDVVRKNSPHCWVNIVKEFLLGLGNSIDIVLIPDARFPNEIDAWKNLENIYSYSIKVIRDNFDNGLTEEQKKHPSETALDSYLFDCIIHNDGSIEKYQGEAEKLAKHLLALS